MARLRRRARNQGLQQPRAQVDLPVCPSKEPAWRRCRPRCLLYKVAAILFTNPVQAPRLQMQKMLETEPERPPVIVFTSGRTGSTLLIRMLNCLPRTIVWGEHGGVLRPLLQSYSSARDVAGNRFVGEAAEHLQPVIERRPITSNPGKMSIEWLNWFGHHDIDALYRGMIRGLFYPDSVRQKFSRWGFKEIRYREPEYDMLRMLFPGMKAIILYRNPADVCASQMKNFAKSDSERFPRLFSSLENFYRFAAHCADDESSEGNPPLFISYEELTEEFEESLGRLELFLGEEFTASIEDIRNNIDWFIGEKDRSRMDGTSLQQLITLNRECGAEVPAKRLQSIAEYYDKIRELGARSASPVSVSQDEA